MKKYFLVVYGSDGFTSCDTTEKTNVLEDDIKNVLYVEENEQESLIWAPKNMKTKRTKNKCAFLVITTEDITENQLGRIYLDKIYTHNVMKTQKQNFEMFIKQISDDVSIFL